MTEDAQRKAYYEWAEMAGDLAATWCERCRVAALDRDAAERARGRRIDWAAELTGVSIQPHTNEGVTATHLVTWPGSSTQGSADLDPLTMQYVRIRERTRPNRLLSIYDRTLPNCRPREIADGICFEGDTEGVEPGFLRSFDVRITRAVPGARRLPTEEQDLVVEILVVEIRDPASKLETANQSELGTANR
jgi:hypothetical protein